MEHEKIVVLLIALILLLAPFDYGLPDVQILTINLILSLIITFICLNSSIKKGWISFRIDSIGIAVICFLILCFISVVYSVHPYSSFTEVMRIITYVLIYFTSANFLSREGFKKVFYIIIFWAGFLSIQGLIEYFYGKGPVKSVFLYHGTFATYLLLIFPLAFSFRKCRTFFLWLGTSGLFAFIVTQSRSGWIAASMSGLFFIHLILRGIKHFNRILCFIILGGLLLLFSHDYFMMGSGLIKRIGTLSSPMGISSARARMKYWDSAIEITKRYLPVGTGIQTFYVIYPLYKDPSFKGCTHHFAHNDYLQIISEVGPLGLIAFLCIIFSFLLTIRSELKKAGEDKDLLLAISFSTIAFCFSCLFEFNIYIPSLMMIVYLYFGFVSKGHGKLIKIRFTGNGILVHSVFAAVVILAAFPYLGQVFGDRGDKAIRRGDIVRGISNYRKASFFSPLSSLPHRKLGNIYFRQRKLNEALQESITAIRLNPLRKENHELLEDIENSY